MNLDSKNYKNLSNKKARQEVINLIELFNLKDMFRQANPEKTEYTWRKKNPIKQARLDFFLISDTLSIMNPKINHNNSYRSGHSPVTLQFKINDSVRGRGFWKVNNSLIYDKEYVDIVKKKINYVKTEYSCLIYNRKNIETIKLDDIQFTINDQLFLDTLLMEIRGKTISYSSFKKKKMLQKEQNLEKEILKLEQNLSEVSLITLTEKQKEYEDIRRNRFKGQCIRSRAKWIEEGEKPSKYFINLESRNYTCKIIPMVEREDGSHTTSEVEILNGTKTFYEKLYKRRESYESITIQEKLNSYDVPKLSNEESNALEGKITSAEVLNFL